MNEVFWVLVFGFAVYFLWHNAQFKSIARDYARQHCKSLGVQLLDDGIVIRGFKPMLNTSGRFVVKRKYQFEFTSTGEHRYHGILEMEGFKPVLIDLEPYQLEQAPID